MAKITLELDDSKTWLVTEAMLMLTSPAGEAMLRAKFPNMNWEIMGKECMELVQQIGAKLPEPEEK